MTEKYSLLPINPQQLTSMQTDLQRLSEKHPDFEIQAVNTIRPQEIEYTRTSEPLVPVAMPLSVLPYDTGAYANIWQGERSDPQGRAPQTSTFGSKNKIIAKLNPVKD